MAVAAASLLTGGGAADAAYPGTNGRIVFERYDDPHWVAASGGRVRKVAKIGVDATDFAYSPNGKKLAFNATVSGGGDQLFTMNADGTNPKVITGNVKGCYDERYPTWSPNGKKLAFICYRKLPPPALEYDIYSINLDGTGLKRVTDLGSDDISYPAWSPLGNKIAFTDSGRVMTVPASGGAENVVNPAAPVAPGCGPCHGTWNWLDWSPDGSMLVVEAIGDGIYVINSTTGALIHGTAPNGLVQAGMEPVFSPDGTKIAYVDTDDSQFDIYTMNVDGTDKRQVTTSGAIDRRPSWGIKPAA